MYLWGNQVTFPSRKRLERWLHAFHLRPLYSKPQNNVLYIPARGWFRELHKRCVEARGQRILHTLHIDSVSVVCTWSGPRVRQVRARGHAANVHCHARIVRVGVHCAFTRLALACARRRAASREGRVNEIPRAHAFTFRGLRRLSAGDSAFAREQGSENIGVIQWIT